MILIRALTVDDRDAWLPLWNAYLSFYSSALPAEVTDATFDRLVAGDGLHGAVACDIEGSPIGFVTWLFHGSTWSTGGYCYLEDLYVAPASRGGGAATALISHVRDAAATAGAEKVYWLTQEHNDRARALYDRVATSTGFVHYELDAGASGAAG